MHALTEASVIYQCQHLVCTAYMYVYTYIQCVSSTFSAHAIHAQAYHLFVNPFTCKTAEYNADHTYVKTGNLCETFCMETGLLLGIINPFTSCKTDIISL